MINSELADIYLEDTGFRINLNLWENRIITLIGQKE